MWTVRACARGARPWPHISSSLLNTLLFGAALEELGEKRGASLSGEQRDPSPGGSVTFVSAANALWGCRTHAS